MPQLKEWNYILEKDTMDVWCNGEVLDTAVSF